MATDTNEKKQGSFTSGLLDKDEKESFDFVTRRISSLQKSRINHHGINLDKLWSDADRDYPPHRLNTAGKGKKVVATDEEKGWRGAMVTLGSTDWQSDVSQANPFVKIQAALSILIDQNPSGVFTPAAKQFQATTDIIKHLYQRSWEYARSKAQLVLFVFNLAKYGWAIARTYPLLVKRKVKVLVQYNQEDPKKSVYEEKEVVEYNDIMRENLDPRNTWIDDMAKPNNAFSLKDWAWRKVYDYDVLKEEFGKYPLWEYVQAGGNTSETLSALDKKGDKDKESDNLVEVLFYENRIKDLFVVIANGVPIIIEPLPIANAKGLKRLSCWHAFWNLRHAESPFGIGIYEAIRYDQGMLDRIRNMTVDQLVLSIYKMFFYQGTQSLTDTGDIVITPGKGKQVLDPKNINWLEVPGPGQESFLGIDMFRKDVDEASGITDPLLGVVTGKTAFEIAQAKESALKRMKNPLDNILEALNTEALISISLMQLLYSIPEVYAITDPRLIADYVHEIQGDPALFERKQTGEVDPATGLPQEQFNAKVYREMPLNLDKDEKGNLIETNETRFYRLKPGAMDWEGVVSIKAQSILSPSKQVDKALELEMHDLLSPMLQGIANERLMYIQQGQPAPSIDNLTQGKQAKSVIKLYDKDPRDILPDEWLKEATDKQDLFVEQAQVQADQQAQQVQQQVQGITKRPAPTLSGQPQGLGGKIVNRLTSMFK